MSHIGFFCFKLVRVGFNDEKCARDLNSMSAAFGGSVDFSVPERLLGSYARLQAWCPCQSWSLACRVGHCLQCPRTPQKQQGNTGQDAQADNTGFKVVVR
eukprot:1328746-Amphidinium_carterae.1